MFAPSSELTYFRLMVPAALYAQASQLARQTKSASALLLAAALQEGVARSCLENMEQRLTRARPRPSKSARQRQSEEAAWVQERQLYGAEGAWHCTLRLPQAVDSRIRSLAFAESVTPGLMASRLLREGWEQQHAVETRARAA